MKTLNASQAFQVVEAIVYNISSKTLQGRQSSDIHGTHIHKLLDALVCFIRTGKKVYALTLTEKEDIVIGTIAVNDPNHLHNLPRFPGPVGILKDTWSRMVACSGTTQKDAKNTELSIYLLEIHLPIMRIRLKKWKAAYNRFRQGCLAEQAAQESTTVDAYLTAVDAVFCASLALCDAFDPETWKVPKESIITFLTIHDTCKQLSTLEAALTRRDWRTITLQEVAGEGFSISRYANKLASPLIHIETILEFCISPKRQGVFRKEFQIETCANPRETKGTLPDEWKTTKKLKTFIEDLYKSTGGSVDSDLCRTLIDDLSTFAAKKISLSLTARPHCECLLIQHHYKRGSKIMGDYIAVSKLSCLQCGMFLDAYNKCVSKEHQFFIRGRHNNAYPAIVPNIDDTLDVDIEAKMKTALTQVISTFIDGRLQRLAPDSGSMHTRSYSESTAASGYRSDDDMSAPPTTNETD